MKNIVELLWEYAISDREMKFYYDYHQAPNWNGLLRNFLFATMDEVRLRHASSFAELSLRAFDVEDAVHFREGVLRREAGMNMAYPKQRDHSAHTVYNWLVGWYMYSHSSIVQGELRKHFALRDLSEPHEWLLFGDLWQFVSLLHDIGYLFEGTLSSLDPTGQSQQAQIGLSVVKDYFNHRFWIECGFGSTADRRRLLRMTGVEEPDFSSADTLTGISDILRSLGDLEGLRRHIAARLSQKAEDPLRRMGGLPSDAFDLWRNNFEYFGQASMVARITSLQQIFERYLYDGFGVTGLRLLDHGVCGGLLLLMFSTYYYRIRFGHEDSSPADYNEERVWELFISRDLTYEPLYWWRGLIWSTAATAIHNIQQTAPSVWPKDVAWPGPLRIEEDPLAYLGILVDCIQEWDRYAVARTGFLKGDLPLQGVDVRAAQDGDVLRICVPSSERAAALANSLDHSLAEWQNLLTVTAI